MPGRPCSALPARPFRLEPLTTPRPSSRNEEVVSLEPTYSAHEPAPPKGKRTSCWEARASADSSSSSGTSRTSCSLSSLSSTSSSWSRIRGLPDGPRLWTIEEVQNLLRGNADEAEIHYHPTGAAACAFAPLPRGSREFEWIAAFVESSWQGRISVLEIDIALSADDKVHNSFLNKERALGELLKFAGSESFPDGSAKAQVLRERITPQILPCSGDVKRFFVCVGVPSEAALNSVVSSGFHRMGYTDRGYFGAGLYAIPSARYAASYSCRFGGDVYKFDELQEPIECYMALSRAPAACTQSRAETIIKQMILLAPVANTTTDPTGAHWIHSTPPTGRASIARRIRSAATKASTTACCTARSALMGRSLTRL